MEDYIDGNDFMIFYCFINGKPFIYNFSSQKHSIVYNRKVVVFGTHIKKFGIIEKLSTIPSLKHY